MLFYTTKKINNKNLFKTVDGSMEEKPKVNLMSINF
jgi:hypothetical protein